LPQCQFIISTDRKRAPNVHCEIASIARVRAAPGSRLISDAEFGAIVRAGLAATLAPANAVVLGLDARQIDAGTAAALVAPPEEPERRIAQMLVNRKVRDAVFRVGWLEGHNLGQVMETTPHGARAKLISDCFCRFLSAQR
jgi:hypothetical protein